MVFPNPVRPKALRKFPKWNLPKWKFPNESFPKWKIPNSESFPSAKDAQIY